MQLSSDTLLEESIVKKARCILASLILCSSAANASFMNIDASYTQPSLCCMNDFHLTLESARPISIGGTLVQPHGAGPAWQPATIAGNGSRHVEINWATGGFLLPFQGVHFGFSGGSGDRFPSEIRVSSADLTRFGSVQSHVALPSVLFQEETGSSRRFDVVRLTMYAAQPGPGPGPVTDPVGVVWWADWGDFAGFDQIVNFTSEHIFATVATATFDHELALSDLNQSLQGFGPESSLLEFAPTAISEPGTLLLMSMGALILLRRRAGNGEQTAFLPTLPRLSKRE